MTDTPVPTSSATPAETITATSTMTAAASPTATDTATPTPTGSPTATLTATLTPTGSVTATPTATIWWPPTPFVYLSVTGEDVVFQPVQLTAGEPQSVPATPPLWEVSNSGSLAGWHLVVQASDFRDGAGHTIPVNNLSVQLSNAEIVAVGDSVGGVTSHAETPVSFSPQGVVLLSAAPGQGVGTFQFTPHFTLTLPGNTVAGDYSAVFTLTMVSGP